MPLGMEAGSTDLPRAESDTGHSRSLLIGDRGSPCVRSACPSPTGPFHWSVRGSLRRSTRLSRGASVPFEEAFSEGDGHKVLLPAGFLDSWGAQISYP